MPASGAPIQMEHAGRRAVGQRLLGNPFRRQIIVEVGDEHVQEYSGSVFPAGWARSSGRLDSMQRRRMHNLFHIIQLGTIFFYF
jgi:hypothetical protein